MSKATTDMQRIEEQIRTIVYAHAGIVIKKVKSLVAENSIFWPGLLEQ